VRGKLNLDHFILEIVTGLDICAQIEID